MLAAKTVAAIGKVSANRLTELLRMITAVNVITSDSRTATAKERAATAADGWAGAAAIQPTSSPGRNSLAPKPGFRSVNQVAPSS